MKWHYSILTANSIMQLFINNSNKAFTLNMSDFCCDLLQAKNSAQHDREYIGIHTAILLNNEKPVCM